MFPVEIHIREADENDLTTKMTTMREWLDHHRFEPSTFRHTYTSPGILFRVHFSVEEEAAMFAKAFGGHLVGEPQAATG